MSYRITEISYDPSKRDELFAYVDTQRDQIKAVNGLQLVHVIDIDEGKSVIIARYESEVSAVAATETVQGILAEMGQFMTAPPNRRGGPITWEM
jgi:hypothetical protein